MFPYNKCNRKNARELRKNMTPEEKHLWYDFLKALPFNVHRQYAIGNYILDFYVAEKKLAIEIDGIQHNAKDNMAKDIIRDSTLSNYGISVLRIPNESIRTCFSRVCEVILLELGIGFNDLKKTKSQK